MVSQPNIKTGFVLIGTRQSKFSKKIQNILCPCITSIKIYIKDLLVCETDLFSTELTNNKLQRAL